MYFDRMSTESIEAEASRAERLIHDHIGTERSKNASFVVLIDDYNKYSKPWQSWPSKTSAQDEVADIFERHGVELDHIVLESSLAGTVHQMFDYLVPRPRNGDGSRVEPQYESPLREDRNTGWLSNGDAPRPRTSSFVGGVLVVDDETTSAIDSSREPQFLRSIALDIQLWTIEDDDKKREKRWACPVLAAWWQLVRLGALQYVSSKDYILPPDTRSRSGAAPLHALQTVTFLEMNYIEVEHAVQSILRQIALPDDWTDHMRHGDDQPVTLAHLERMTYVFSPQAPTYVFSPQAP